MNPIETLFPTQAYPSQPIEKKEVPGGLTARESSSYSGGVSTFLPSAPAIDRPLLSRRSLLVVGCALFILSFLTANDAKAKANGGRFVNLQFQQIGAGYAGMGGGHVALPMGASGGYWNPALLSRIPAFEFHMEGSYGTGPKVTTTDGQNELDFQEKSDFGLVGFFLPGSRGFDYAVLEATRYDHDIQGFLFDTPAFGDISNDANRQGGRKIADYDDRVSIHSVGFLTSYETTENSALGLGLWLDRKKVFKSIDYLNGTPPTDIQVDSSFIDLEGATSDVGVRISFGFYWRASAKLRLGAALNTSTNLESTLETDVFFSNTFTRELAEIQDETPLTIQIGFVYEQAFRFRYAVDLLYERWSVYDHLDNVVQIHAGAEYDWSEKLALRGGLFTVFDPINFEDDAEYAEYLRSVEVSGALDKRDELFLTLGAGYRHREYLQLEASVYDSHIFASDSGQTGIRLGFRLIAVPPGN